LSLLIYPTLPGLTFPVLKSQEFETDVQSAKNRYESRQQQMVNPIWHWQLIYDFLRDFQTGNTFAVTELRKLMDFFAYQGGQAGDFLYLDPDDNSVGPAMNAGVPNTPYAQLPLVTDGTSYYSPLQRTLGGLFFEDVTDLNTDTGAGGSALAVYANGVLAVNGTDYTLLGPGLALPSASYMGLYLKWTAAPTPPITAQFNFYFRVRFESDERDMEKFVNAFWTIGGSESQNGSGYLKLVSARPNPA
jgi:Conserved hypothetical protein 2217 (DUF2460)